MRNYLVGLIMVTCLSSGCAGFGLGIKAVKGDDNSVKESNFGVNTKVKASANVKADVKATGLDMSKTIGTEIISNQGVDMETLMYILGGFFTLMTGLITKMFIQLAKKDQIILDLGNDGKEILLKIIPMFILMHDKEAFESFMKLKIEYETAVDKKVQEATAKKWSCFRKKEIN